MHDVMHVFLRFCKRTMTRLLTQVKPKGPNFPFSAERRKKGCLAIVICCLANQQDLTANYMTPLASVDVAFNVQNSISMP